MFEHDGPLFQRLKLVLKTNDSFRGWLWLSNPLRMAVEAPVSSSEVEAGSFNKKASPLVCL